MKLSRLLHDGGLRVFSVDGRKPFLIVQSPPLPRPHKRVAHLAESRQCLFKCHIADSHH